MLIYFDFAVHQEGDCTVMLELFFRGVLYLGIHYVDHGADLSIVTWLVHPVYIINTVYVLLGQNRFLGQVLNLAYTLNLRELVYKLLGRGVSVSEIHH